MGVDGISMWLVLLTTFLTPLCVLISWSRFTSGSKSSSSCCCAGNRADRRLRLARSVPLLLLLGSNADPDGAADRHVRPRPARLRRGEVLPVHHGRVGLHAGGDHLALRQTGTFDFVAIQKQICRAGSWTPSAAKWLFLGFFVAFAVKVPMFPLPHMAAGCARGSAHGRLGAAGRRTC